MDLKLRNKVALIGGSSKGLGLACALRLAQEGANVVICSNENNSIEKAKEKLEKFGVKVLALEADMTSKEDNERIINETIKTFGRLDILINNSGGPPPGNFFDLSENDWQKSFESILLYVIRLCKLAVPHMQKNKWGRIINLTSLVVKEPSENLILSNVFRVGVVSMAKTLSRELVRSNITINNICPGAFKTDRAIELMNKSAERQKKSVEEIEANAIKGIPLGRYQQPEELGDLVAFLCSELACSITGTTIQIDGGISRGLF